MHDGPSRHTEHSLKVYFAHHLNGTALQAACLTAISLAFRGCEIVNPDSPENRAAYLAQKASTGSGMAYFTESVIPSCDACAFLACPDGKITSGVWMEIERAAELGKPLYEVCDLGAWISHGRMFCMREPDTIEELRVFALTLEETLRRIRTVDGSLHSNAELAA